MIEEYVATRQPVGSRSLVERAGFAVSSSTIRSELAELESLGLLMHPHTSAGRIPTEAGYRVYAEELVAASEGRPVPFPVDLSAMRGEVEAALQQTTETLSEATKLLALVSAPAIDAAVVRHVEVLQLQPRTVIVVLITATGGVTKRVFEADHPLDPGVVEWAREYLNETMTGQRMGVSSIRRKFDDPSFTPRERAFLTLIRPAFVEVLETNRIQLFVGGTAGLLEESWDVERDAAQRLLGLLEHRAAVLALLSDALDPRRTVVRVGPEVDGAEYHEVAYVGSTYGTSNRSLGGVGLLGPLRMDYEKAITAVRAAAFELSRLVEDVYESS